MKTIIGKITIDILTSIYQPFWFAILLSIMTMFFYLYVKCPEGAGKGWKAAIRTWIDHFKRDREFRKKYILLIGNNAPLSSYTKEIQKPAFPAHSP